MYYLFIDYFDVDRVSDIDSLHYSAGSLVAFVQQGADPANLSFVSSSVFIVDKSLTCSFDILDSSVLHVLNVDSTPAVGFSIRFDLPYQLLITSSAFSFLYSFYASDFGGGSTVDLTPVLDGISTLQNQLNSLSFPQTDLTPVLTKLDNLNYPDIDINAFNFYSLNGNCGSLPDGTLVTVTGLEGDFEVSSSQFTWNDSTAQMSMIMYKLSKDGSFCLVPDVYVTKKV